MPNIQLSNNLRYLRKKYGLTQSQMGEILNISRQAYSNYETNSRTPDLDTLLFLADFYKVSLDDIVLTNLKDKMPYPGKNDRISEDPVPYIFTKNTTCICPFSDYLYQLFIHFPPFQISPV